MAGQSSSTSLPAQVALKPGGIPATRTRGLLSALRADPLPLLIPPVMLVLGLWHLDRYPRTWFDEGMYLQVAKNFAEHGLYAVRSADGTIDYAPIVGVGPTVLMPAALAFRFLGVDLAAARLVPVLALLIATLLFYLIARALFGRLAAGCGLLLLLSLPAIDWLATGRQLLGEAPAVALLLAGAACAWREGQRRVPVLGGVLLGLTMVTKGQYLLVLPATICAVAVFDRIITRQRPLRWYVWLLGITIATYGCWIAALLLALNEGQVGENVRQLRASSGGALLIINRVRMIAGLRFLLGPRTFFLAVPALLGGGWLAWRTTGPRRLAVVALWIFQALWLTWFSFASIAWPRYAFPGLVINALFMGALVAQLPSTLGARGLSRGRWATGMAGGVLALALALLVAIGAWRAVEPLARRDQREPQVFAREVTRLVPADATIDGWEPEIGFLIDRPVQHPPLGTLDRVVRARWLGGDTTTLDLSAQLRAPYLMVGPFARWVGVYSTAVNSPDYRLIARVGEYELYQRIVGAAVATPESEGR